MTARFRSLRVLSYAMLVYGSFAVWLLFYSEGTIAWVLGDLTDGFVRSGVWSLGLGIVLGVILQLKAQRQRVIHWIVLALALVPFVKGVFVY